MASFGVKPRSRRWPCQRSGGRGCCPRARRGSSRCRRRRRRAGGRGWATASEPLAAMKRQAHLEALHACGGRLVLGVVAARGSRSGLALAAGAAQEWRGRARVVGAGALSSDVARTGSDCSRILAAAGRGGRTRTRDSDARARARGRARRPAPRRWGPARGACGASAARAVGDGRISMPTLGYPTRARSVSSQPDVWRNLVGDHRVGVASLPGAAAPRGVVRFCVAGGWSRPVARRASAGAAPPPTKAARRSPTRSPRKQNYDKGLEELKDENYPEAIRYFSFVKQKFPFSKYAVLAELALADTQFARGSYQEAIDAYKSFARLHPTHEKVEDGYVAYKICDCYVKDMPSDWALVPPAYEKDQSAVRDAHRELTDFLDKYPDSKYLAEVKKLHREVMARLIEHEVYVARFYLDGGHPKAAILRIEAALATLSRVGARGRAAAGARADPPRDGQPACGRGRPSSAWSKEFTRSSRPSARSSSSSSSSASTATTHGTRTPRGNDGAAHAAMDERTRRLLERGREHYAAGEYDKAARCLVQVLRNKHAFADVYHMLGVIYAHQGLGKRAPGDVRGGAQAQPRVHGGRDEPGGHLQRGGALRGGARGPQAHAGRAAGGAGPGDELDGRLLHRGRWPTCTPSWPTRTSRRGCSSEAIREFERALALCPSFRRHSQQAGRRLTARSAISRRRVREFERVKKENPRLAGAAAAAGADLLRRRRADEAAREWREVMEMQPEQQVRQALPRRHRRGPSAPDRATRAHSRAGRGLHRTAAPGDRRGRSAVEAVGIAVEAAHGAFRSRPETFLVEEIPAYRPGGAGEHTYCWIEKRDLTTHEAVRRLARALGVADRDVGYAGLKDRHAITRQWLSLPGRARGGGGRSAPACGCWRRPGTATSCAWGT